MKKLFFIVTLLITGNIVSQQTNYDINKNTLSEYFQNEKNYVGGKILDISFSNLYDELSHVSYIRSDSSVPDIDLIVRYIFFKKDSLIKEIRYEWDITNYNKKINNKKDLEFRKLLSSFFLRMESELSATFGKSKSEGNLRNGTVNNDSDDYYKTNKWTLENTIIELNIEMSNNYDKEKGIFPTHKVLFKQRAINLINKPNYNNKELIKRIRKEIPNIETPIVGGAEPIFPGCDKSKDKYNCMYNHIQQLVIKEVKSKDMYIENDTLKLGFMVEINGKITPWKHSIKSKNKDLENIGLYVIENLPNIRPSYSEKMKKNVASGNTFYVIIKENTIMNKFE